jgi:hypothetical protein
MSDRVPVSAPFLCVRSWCSLICGDQARQTRSAEWCVLSYGEALPHGRRVLRCRLFASMLARSAAPRVAASPHENLFQTASSSLSVCVYFDLKHCLFHLADTLHGTLRARLFLPAHWPTVIPLLVGFLCTMQRLQYLSDVIDSYC